MGHKIPDFLIVGAAKSGTTSIYNFLRQHPDVYMPTLKEPNFFSGIKVHPSIVSEEQYVPLFAGCKVGICGEASVSYLPFYKIAIPNIKSLLNEPKIIIVLRNPTDRAFSHYTYFRQLGLEKNPLAKVMADDYRVQDDPWGGVFNPYIEPGNYFEQVKAYTDNFEQTLIIFLEELKDKDTICRKLYEFLDIDSSFIPNLEIRNVSGVPKFKLVSLLLSSSLLMHNVVRYIPYSVKKPIRDLVLKKPIIDAQNKQRLDYYYFNNIKQLESLTGKKLTSWYNE